METDSKMPRLLVSMSYPRDAPACPVFTNTVAAADPSALFGWHACLYSGQDLQAKHQFSCIGRAKLTR